MACGPPQEVIEARGTPSADIGPAPVLLPTENFSDALASAASETDRLDTETEALAVRAAALQARAAALSAGPVLPPDESARLARAATP